MVAPAPESEDFKTASHPVPTPEEIRQRAAEVRKHWSDNVRRRRRCDSIDTFQSTIQIVRLADIQAAGSEN